MTNEELAREGRICLVEFARRLDARLIPRGPNNDPYLWRGYLLGSDEDDQYNTFLHRFVASDAEGELHCHPWSRSISHILLGSYEEISCSGLGRPATSPEDWGKDGNEVVLSEPRKRVFSPGMQNVTMANTFHHVRLLTPEVWTLFIHGPRVQPWGFVEEGRYGVALPMRIVKGKTSEARQRGNMAEGMVP